MIIFYAERWSRSPGGGRWSVARRCIHKMYNFTDLPRNVFILWILTYFYHFQNRNFEPDPFLRSWRSENGQNRSKIDLKQRVSIKSKFLPGRPRFKPPARPPPPPDRGLPATRPRPNYRPWAENMPFKKNIETLGRKKYFLFLIPSIYIKIRNGQTLEKR